MTRVRTLFAEALRSIGANVSTTVASALSVLIGMFLIGVFIGLGTWLVSWSDDKKTRRRRKKSTACAFTSSPTSA